MTEYFDGWLTNLSKYIADLNTELVKTKAENAELLRELDLTKRMYAKVSEEKCVADSENAKLRELVRKYGEYTDQDRCEGCVCKSRCSDGDVDECWQLTEIRELTCELGVGVDE